MISSLIFTLILHQQTNRKIIEQLRYNGKKSYASYRFYSHSMVYQN
ncbi:hypothetical protein ACWIYZ_00755 [Ursidibacter arcticus]